MIIKKYNENTANQSVMSIKNSIKEYQKFITDIRPFVMEEYDRLVEDDSYQPEYGDTPKTISRGNELEITGVGVGRDGLEFTILEYDNNAFICGNYYVFLTDAEVEDCIMKMSAQKYNL